jgi:hypothetical protein
MHKQVIARLDYASLIPWVERTPDGILALEAHALHLSTAAQTDGPWRWQRGGARVSARCTTVRRSPLATNRRRVGRLGVAACLLNGSLADISAWTDVFTTHRWPKEP